MSIYSTHNINYFISHVFIMCNREMLRNQKEAKRIQNVIRKDSSGDTVELKQLTSELKEMTSFLRNVLEHYLVMITACKEHKVEMECPLSLTRMIDALVESSEGVR